MNRKYKPNLIRKYGKYFNETIKQRGREYYKNNKVIICQKINNKYIAKVSGSNYNYHKVTIDFIDGDINMSCTCPCNFNCKHEYATLITIKNHEYQIIHLKPKINRQKEPLSKTIKKIPAKELKEYFCKDISNLIDFDKEKFETKFINYFPNQSYNYYYNNLYNSILLKDDYIIIIRKYNAEAMIKINAHKYRESFIIIKAIVNALIDTGNLDSPETLKILSTIRVLQYVIIKNAGPDLIKDIENWFKYIIGNKFFNSFVLDLFVSSEYAIIKNKSQKAKKTYSLN